MTRRPEHHPAACADPSATSALLSVLVVGRCEPMKAVVHGVLLGTAALCVLYNAAAWMRRRERHLAVNTILYSFIAGLEHVHVRHHLACRPERLVVAEVRIADAA